MQPVVTKVSPADEENDIDLIRNILNDHFKNEIDHETGKVTVNKDVNIKFDNDQDADDDQTNLNKQKIEDINAFYNNFVDSFEIFDPLDRSVPQDDDCAIKKDALLE